MNKKNVLYKTRCYLAGAMEYAKNGRGWREIVKSELDGRNITLFDPYIKPFIHNIPEDETSRKEMLHWMETEQYDLVAQRMKKVRGYDLRLVDVSDWFICMISPNTPTFGTMEELSLMVREQKPVFVVIDNPKGKRACPIWILGMIEPKHIYNNLQEALDVIKAIDDGIIAPNSDKWKLIMENLR